MHVRSLKKTKTGMLSLSLCLRYFICLLLDWKEGCNVYALVPPELVGEL